MAPIDEWAIISGSRGSMQSTVSSLHPGTRAMSSPGRFLHPRKAEHEVSSSMTSFAAKGIAVAVGLPLALLSAPACAVEGGNWKDGADVYAKICAYCHDVGGGPVIKGRQLPPEYISLIVRQGLRAMPAFRSSFLDDKALQALGECLSKSPTPTVKP